MLLLRPTNQPQQQHCEATLRNAFRKADRNGDGELTRAELILRLRKDVELGELLNLPSKIGDDDRDAFERVSKYDESLY